MTWHQFWTFASEAEVVAIWGIGCLLIAIFAAIAELRATKRARIDRVGLVPWRAVFLASAMIGSALVALGGQGMLAG
jgi:hypothetical protein